MGFGYNEFDTGFGMEFQLFNVMFFLIFFLILGMFLFMIVKGLSTWNNGRCYCGCKADRCHPSS